jgi:hypothetical protein
LAASSAADLGFKSQSRQAKYNNGWQPLVQQIMGLNLSHVKLNTIMVGSLTSSAADHGFESQSRQTKYNNGWQPLVQQIMGLKLSPVKLNTIMVGSI